MITVRSKVRKNDILRCMQQLQYDMKISLVSEKIISAVNNIVVTCIRKKD